MVIREQISEKYIGFSDVKTYINITGMFKLLEDYEVCVKVPTIKIFLEDYHIW